MNKAELVEAVAATTKQSKAASARMVDAVLQAVVKGLKKDKAVQLVGFGTFRVKTRKARKGRNPKTGEVIKIPASKTVTFKPGSELKKTIK